MQDLRPSLLSAIKPHSFSNYFVSLFSPLKFLGLHLFSLAGFPLLLLASASSQGVLPFHLRCLTLALEVELGQERFLNTCWLGRSSVCWLGRSSVVFPVSGGTLGEAGLR